jgi:hypothetical protein
MLRKWTQSDSRSIEIITRHQVPNKVQSYNFKMQHKDYGPQSTRSLVISSQKPTSHKCGNSFFNNKVPILI